MTTDAFNPYDIPPVEDPLELADGLSALQAMSKDLKLAAQTLSGRQARFLVDYYYQMQRNRIRAGHQALKAAEGEEPGLVASWTLENSRRLEHNVQQVLNVYSNSTVVGRWSRSICGIGPVISAGLLAHIDMEPWRCNQDGKHCTVTQPHDGCGRKRLQTAGGLWRFAGLDPTLPRMAKGTKRPWNARLKTLTWKLGESYVKVSGNPRDIYGKVYIARKALEIQRNEAGLFADQAAQKLKEFKIGEDTEAYGWYSQGTLPPAHIHARAKRYAVKLYLAHHHAVAYEVKFGEAPPKPYVLEHMGHVAYIAPPHWENGAITDGR